MIIIYRKISGKDNELLLNDNKSSDQGEKIRFSLSYSKHYNITIIKFVLISNIICKTKKELCDPQNEFTAIRAH